MDFGANNFSLTNFCEDMRILNGISEFDAAEILEISVAEFKVHERNGFATLPGNKLVRLLKALKITDVEFSAFQEIHRKKFAFQKRIEFLKDNNHHQLAGREAQRYREQFEKDLTDMYSYLDDL